MVSRMAQWTIDVLDVERMAQFWSQALGYATVRGNDGAAKLFPVAPDAGGPLTVWLQPTPTRKVGKNRCHLDLAAAEVDLETEVRRLLALGARRADIGQADDDRLVVLVDPEGNEFCVLRDDPRG